MTTKQWKTSKTANEQPKQQSEERLQKSTLCCAVDVSTRKVAIFNASNAQAHADLIIAMHI